MRRGAVAHFLSDALVDQHVGVDGHAQRQGDGRDARQRQRGLQQRQQCHQEQQVGGQRDDRDKAEQHVIGDHEDGDGGEAPHRRMKTLLDVLGAQARADGAFFDDVHRRGERAGAQQQRRVVGFHRAHAAGNLHAATADFGADDRCGDYFALALLDEQDGHALADVFTGDVLEDARAGGVQREVHRWFMRLIVEAGLRVGQPVAGQRHLLLDQERPAAAFDVEFGAERHLAGECRFQCARRVVDHADFQRCRAPEDVFCLGRILHAGELHDDAVGALLRDHRFGHAEFVDPVVQRTHVLLDGEFLNLVQGGGLERGNKAQVAAFALLDERQFRLRIFQGEACLVERFGIAEADDHPLAFATDAAVADALVAQYAAQVGADRIQALGQRPLHVDLQQEMYTAAQVKPEVHGQRAEVGQPARRAGQQVERHDVLRIGRVGIELLLQQILGLQLGVGVFQTNLDAGGVEENAAGGHASRLQRGFDAIQGGGIDLDRGLGAGYLHGGRFAEEVGQGVDETDQQRDDDDDVLPERVAVHFRAEGREVRRTGPARAEGE